MPPFDSQTLPDPLAAYFAAEDHTATAPLFASAATVRDEGETLTGSAAIADWLKRVKAKYRPRYNVKAAAQEGDRCVVTVEVSGTFPGSPVTLRQAFILRDGLIVGLETL